MTENAPSPNQTETNFGVAGAILVAAAGLVTLSLNYIPVHILFDLPADMLATIKTVANIACIAIALGIAVASYADYRKSRSRTLVLSVLILIVAFTLLTATHVMIRNWVVALTTCEDSLALAETGEAEPKTPEQARGIRIIIPATLPRMLTDTANSRGLGKLSHERQIEELACEGEKGFEIRQSISERTETRRLILTAMPILVITGLFTGLTLLSWTLIFVKGTGTTKRSPAAARRKR